MSDKKPTDPYIYQPGPAGSSERIYAVAGPGTEAYEGKRFTKLEAELLLGCLAANTLLTYIENVLTFTHGPTYHSPNIADARKFLLPALRHAQE